MVFNFMLFQVYLHLLKIYLYPPGPLTLGLQEYSKEPKPKTLQALAMLETHASLINLYKVCVDSF